jgi:hypothetical protein
MDPLRNKIRLARRGEREGGGGVSELTLTHTLGVHLIRASHGNGLLYSQHVTVIYLSIQVHSPNRII